MHRLIPTFLLSIAIGCSQQPSPTTPTTSNNTSNASSNTTSKATRQAKRTVVRDMIAEIMDISAAQLSNDTPLGQLPTPMDNLDLVELVMELEESERVMIPDHLLIEFSDAKNTFTLQDHLTIDNLARILEIAKPMREIPVTLD